MGCTGILNIFVKENVVPTGQNKFCHLYHFQRLKDTASNGGLSLIYPRWALATMRTDSSILTV